MFHPCKDSTWMKKKDTLMKQQRSSRYQRRSRMNTHFFDGKLKEAKEQLAPYLSDVEKINKAEKLELFALFATLLVSRPTTTPQSQHNLQIIITDYQKHQPHTGPNYDSSNDLASEDLLYFLADLISKIPEDQRDDFLDLANQQLTEMSSGMCPQGRSYRILQVIWPTLDCVTKPKS